MEPRIEPGPYIHPRRRRKRPAYLGGMREDMCMYPPTTVRSTIAKIETLEHDGRFNGMMVGGSAYLWRG